mgnify:FL=1
MQFTERLDNIKFAHQQQQLHDISPFQTLKALKVAYVEAISRLRKLFEESMVQLEDCTRYYSAAEQALP